MTAAVRDLEPAPDGSPERLLGAVLAISADLDLDSVLSRLVEAAADLTGARHVTLGPVGRREHGDVVTDGLDELLTESRDRPSGPAFLVVPIRVRGTDFSTLCLTGKDDGGAFTARDRDLVVALARAAALVIENALAYGASERRRQVLEASAALSDALEPPVAVAEALREVTVRARLLAGAATGMVVQFPEGAHPVIAASDSAAQEDLAPIVRRILDELRVVEDGVVAVDIDLGDRWGLAVPLLAHLADPGALVLITHERPTHDERDMVLGYADQAGLALDRVQALTEREELAVVTERARIGSDLHDVVIQRLFAAGLKLQALATEPRTTGLGPRIDDVVADLDVTIQDIRTTIFGLQPEAP